MKKKLSLIKLSKLEISQKLMTSLRGGYVGACTCLCNGAVTFNMENTFVAIKN
jgi:natural product precursor